MDIKKILEEMNRGALREEPGEYLNRPKESSEVREPALVVSGGDVDLREFE